MKNYTEKELSSQLPIDDQIFLSDMFDKLDKFDKAPNRTKQKAAYMEFHHSILNLKQHWIDEHESEQVIDAQYNSRRG